MIEKRLFSFKETMAYLGIGRLAITRLMKEGKLMNISISNSFRFDKNDLDNFIETQKKTLVLKAS